MCRRFLPGEVTRHHPGGNLPPPETTSMPATVIDPDYGLIDLNFTPGKAETDPPDFTIDVYDAVEKYQIVQKKYLKELEAENRNADASQAEVLKRWAAAVFTGNDQVKPSAFSTAVCKRALVALLSAQSELKKKESVSSTPD